MKSRIINRRNRLKLLIFSQDWCTFHPQVRWNSRPTIRKIVLQSVNSQKNRKEIIVKVDRRHNEPKARQEQLIIKELPDELLIYDLQHDKAHCLNETAALVWKNCDGRRSVGQLRELLEASAGSAVPEEMVWLALEQLETFKLLEEAPSKPALFAGMSRRDMVRRVGIAAIAVPAILSIVAPTAQAQASGLPPGSCCTTPNDCASSSCINSGSCTPPPSKLCA
jgi:hypothetical protein